MENKINVKEALRYLKEGYLLLSEANHLVYRFAYTAQDHKIHVRSQEGGFLLKPEDFLSLYDTSFFSLDEKSQDEETVDPKKDEEYYSWRQ